MKRIELVQRLVKEGMSEKTLANFNDKQIISLSEIMLSEQTSGQLKGSVQMKKTTNPTDVKKITDSGINVTLNEKLKGNQKKLDKNHNGKIDGQDFKILKGQKKEVKESDMGLTIKSAPKSTSLFGGSPKKSSTPSFGKSATPKKKSTPKKKEEGETGEGEDTLHDIIHGAIKDKLKSDLGREPEQHEVEEEHQKYIDGCKTEGDEPKKEDGDKKFPFKKKKEESKDDDNKSKGGKENEMDEMLRFYDDDGNPIKNKKGEQDAVSDKDKKFKEKTKSKKCSDCNKDIKDCKCDHSHLDENRKIKNWVNNLVENEKYHSFTSKNEIMELIQSKINESETMTASVGPRVKKGHNGIPEFMTYEAIKSGGPAVAPTKPKPGTKPGTNPGTKPKTPYRPGIKPSPKPKASFE